MLFFSKVLIDLPEVDLLEFEMETQKSLCIWSSSTSVLAFLCLAFGQCIHISEG